jgi:phosphohistidine phosphatase SixA
VVLCSPTYRARETLRWAGIVPTRIDAELGDGGQSMAGTTALQTAWLRQQANELPDGSNTLIVTHYPNIVAAFASEAAGLEDGEALIIGPDGRGGTVVRARIRIEEWPRLGP